MNIIKRTRTEFNFLNVESRIKLVNADTNDIYFINAVDARQVYNELKNSETFDNYNEVCIKDSHTLSITGETDIHYDKDNKILTIFSFA